MQGALFTVTMVMHQTSEKPGYPGGQKQPKWEPIYSRIAGNMCLKGET
jgi:hypothetical protein